MGLHSVSRYFPPCPAEGSLEGAWEPGVYSLGCPVPAWVGLDIVFNRVTAEKGERKNKNLPSVSASGSTSATALQSLQDLRGRKEACTPGGLGSPSHCLSLGLEDAWVWG